MFAVIRIGGKQYLVQEDEILKVESLKEKEGKEITIKDILLISSGKDAEIGEPNLSKAKVSAKIIKHGKAKKIVVFKYKRRKGYRKKQGHRQQYTELKIGKIIGEKIKPLSKKTTQTRKKESPKLSTKKSVTKKFTTKQSVKK